MAGPTKNQHYVPKSYINRFSENGRVSVYCKNDGEILSNQNPRNFASARYYYDTSRDELEALMREYVALIPEMQQSINWDDSQFLEHYFVRVEDDAKELFDRIEQDPNEINIEGNIGRIVIFLHDLAYRNHAYRDDIAKINAVTYGALSRINLSESERQYVEITYGKKQARNQQFHAITNVAPVLQTYQKLFGEYDLFFATVKGNARFLISDDPVFSVRHDCPEVCFPLSGKHALLFRKPGVTTPLMGTDVPVGSNISISIPNVVRYNLLQFCFASRYVFGDAMNLEQMKLVWDNIQKANALHSQS